jgi:hypothetical protein
MKRLRAVGFETTNEAPRLLAIPVKLRISLPDYCLNKSLTEWGGYDSRCHTTYASMAAMKVPVMTIRQVQENNENTIRDAAEDVRRVVNGGLVPHYFVQKKAGTIVTHLRMKHERKLSSNT